MFLTSMVLASCAQNHICSAYTMACLQLMAGINLVFTAVVVA